MGTYTKEMYKNEIQKFLGNYNPVVVAKSTSTILFKHRADIDLDLEEKMLDIMTMEDGPEFEMTEDEFRKFLDAL